MDLHTRNMGVETSQMVSEDFMKITRSGEDRILGNANTVVMTKAVTSFFFEIPVNRHASSASAFSAPHGPLFYFL